jgi:hypothetical protein
MPQPSFQSLLGIPEIFFIRERYTTVCDYPRSKSIAVNPRHIIYCVKSYTVNMRYLTCRICDSMRHVVVFCIETAVLQVSTENNKMFDVTYKTYIGDLHDTTD